MSLRCDVARTREPRSNANSELHLHDAPAGERQRALPRYRTIAAELSRRIDNHELPPGSLLPSESELAVQFGVTRMTVRQALAGLAAQGVIERRHGHGTIVTPIRLRRQSAEPVGLAQELVSRGLIPGSHILELEEMSPTPEVRAALWLGPRSKVFRLFRLRYASQIPIGLQESMFPVKYAPDLDIAALEGRSMMQVLREQHGLIATHSDFDIQAVAADRRTAALLEVDVATPMLQTTSVTYLESGRPLERTVGWFIGSRYSFHVRRGAPRTSM